MGVFKIMTNRSKTAIEAEQQLTDDVAPKKWRS